ncbi:MAG: cytidylate kinase-like family protein [Ruminococcaceae bacterium]|nr:cytidylate kinase-like family protein [Oscillospiraceae bacterium]
MNIKYITIEREYGSGGTEIARRLAKETGISCYGREILEQVSKENEISVDQIENYEETVSNSFLYSVFVMAKAASGDTDMLMEEGHIYVAEQAVIRRFANLGSSVFLGHCACEALKDFDGVLNVFIRCSDEKARTGRIVSYGIFPEKADTVRRRFDKKRANYYYANTLKKWDDLRNYDLVLDSGVLGIEGCVAVLKSLLNL